MNEAVETMEQEEEQKQEFCIYNDLDADWAVKQLKKDKEDYDRLMKMVEAERFELLQREQEIKAKYENRTAFLRDKLYGYMSELPHDAMKYTATQASYELLHGKLVFKNGTTDFERDEEALVGSLGDNKHSEFVKVKLSVDWANLKKHVKPLDNGMVVMDDGTVLDGIKAVKKQGTFDIKFK